MAAKHLIGIDVGTTGVKGVAVDLDGTVVARAETGYRLSTPRAGWSEQDPDDWWQATQQVIARLPDGAGIGLSGQMHGLVVLDAGDHVVRPAILWNDQRTATECDAIEARVPDLIARTGNRALTGFTAPKLMWMQRHEPDLHARIRKVMLPKDYVRLRLTGEHATDVTDASGTLWLDVAKRDWSSAVLQALEVPSAWLPRLLESPDVSGMADGDTPVAAGAGDQAAGALAAGVVRAGGPLSVVLGTSGVVFAAQDSFVPDPEGRVHAFCHAEPGAWHTMGVILSAAGSLRWLRDTVAPGMPYDKLIAGAAAWPPGCEGLTFLPYLAGERTPHADPLARGSFTGLSLRHDRGALVRAVLEGVAFALRDALDLVGATSVGRVSGGGARSDEWLRIVASVLELPLERTAADDEAAYGAALLGGVTAGVWNDVTDAVAETVKVTTQIDPLPEWVEPYQQARRRFRALYPALRDSS